jgi:soluble lytic murein transglycosylase-like protein
MDKQNRQNRFQITRYVLILGVCLLAATVPFFNAGPKANSGEVVHEIEPPDPLALNHEALTKAFLFLPESTVKQKKKISINNKALSRLRGKEAEQLLHPMIHEVASQYDVDPSLIKAIIWAESSFNPSAVSKRGAVGLMQLMPATARSLGMKNIRDPESNIYCGVRYFKQLMVQFNGDPKLALAAYNAGSDKVVQYNGIPPFEDTRYYIKKVFRYYHRYKGRELQKKDRF